MQGLCFKKKTISPNIFLTCEPLQQHTLGGIGIEFLDSWFDTQNAVLNKKTPHGVAYNLEHWFLRSCHGTWWLFGSQTIEIKETDESTHLDQS